MKTDLFAKTAGEAAKRKSSQCTGEEDHALPSEPGAPRWREKGTLLPGIRIHRKRLADSLILHAQENEIVETEVTKYGTRYVVDSALAAPDGTVLNIRSAWYIDHGSDAPRFVTAHPLSRR